MTADPAALRELAKGLADEVKGGGSRRGTEKAVADDEITFNQPANVVILDQSAKPLFLVRIDDTGKLVAEYDPADLDEAARKLLDAMVGAYVVPDAIARQAAELERLRAALERVRDYDHATAAELNKVMIWIASRGVITQAGAIAATALDDIGDAEPDDSGTPVTAASLVDAVPPDAIIAAAGEAYTRCAATVCYDSQGIAEAIHVYRQWLRGGALPS